MLSTSERRTHSAKIRKWPIEDKFWSWVERVGATDEDCWLWAGGVDYHPGGSYGRFQRRRAHKVAYELLVGPIDLGKVLDHLCRNRLCVNPAHLESTTNRENILRGHGTAAVNARKTHCYRGHPLVGSNLYINPSSGDRRCETCRRKHWKKQ